MSDESHSQLIHKQGANFKCGENVITKKDVVVGDELNWGTRLPYTKASNDFNADLGSICQAADNPERLKI